MSQAEVNRIVAVGKQYTNLCPNQSFFSWGGDNHLTLSLGGRDEALFHQRYNQAVGGGSNAGPGLYVTTSLTDSASYCPAMNGVLLQVDMPDGIPYIRVSDVNTMNALRQGQPTVNTQMLYRQNADIPPVLLNHAGTWHCLKTTKGVGFRKFDGRGVTVPNIQLAVNTLRVGFPAAAAVLLAQLKPEVRVQIQ